MSESNKLHYNPFQIRCLVQYPHKLVAIAGRGTGKSTGVIAPRMLQCILRMPGSNNGLVAKTFKQIKSRTLPATISGWKKLGFYPDVHYVIGKKADKKMRFLLPDEEPADWENVLHFFDGSIVSMSSQDRKNDGNGLNLQSLHGDEAKMLEFESLTEELLPTLRGLPKYKNLVEYRMQTYTSDMPTTPEGKWLLKAEEECDPTIVDLIFQLDLELQDKRKALTNAKAESTIRRLMSEINTIHRKMKMLRIPDRKSGYEGHTYFAEASSFENIDALTPEYIRLQKRNLPDFIFQTSILNHRPIGIQASKMFYPMLRSRHFYTDYNYNHLDKIKIVTDYDETIHNTEEVGDCLGDNDVLREPLDISLDWGGNINSMLVGQYNQDRHVYRFLKEFFAEAEEGEHIKHVVKKFCEYYRAHPVKEIDMYYDRNGNSKVANSDETYAEYARRLLYEEGGWNVTLKSYEENPNHTDKYKFMIIALSGSDPRLPAIEINSGNCPNLEIALYNAPIKTVNGRVVKNKYSEDPKSKIPMKQATHITDAFDYVYVLRFRDYIEEAIGNFMGIFM